MTEEEWLATLDPLTLLQNLHGKPSWRKLRLASVACCRRFQQLLVDERSRRAVDVAELYADRLHSFADTMEIEGQATQVVHQEQPFGSDPLNDAAHCAAMCLALWAPAPWGTFQVFQTSASFVSRTEQLSILACIFGVPHRQRVLRIAFSPAWQTDTVLALARQMYESRDFGAMPILADALQEAGCDSDELLSHLRDPNAAHVRGCWALDRVLGKE